MWNILLIGFGVSSLTMIGYLIVLMAIASKQNKENKYWSYKIKE